MAEPITNVLGIVGMENKGAYDANAYYEKLNVVSYQGSSYCALNSVHNVLPTDTTKWQLIAEKGDKGDTGEEGYTPIKGTDYYTAADKAELETTLSSDVTTEVTSQLGSLTSATPLVASSTAGMTDTTRVYVNTSDGHWYWYDGDSWEDGGIYQATGIDKYAITIDKLAKNLEDKYEIKVDWESGGINGEGELYGSTTRIRTKARKYLRAGDVVDFDTSGSFNYAYQSVDDNNQPVANSGWVSSGTTIIPTNNYYYFMMKRINEAEIATEDIDTVGNYIHIYKNISNVAGKLLNWYAFEKFLNITNNYNDGSSTSNVRIETLDIAWWLSFGNLIEFTNEINWPSFYHNNKRVISFDLGGYGTYSLDSEGYRYLFEAVLPHNYALVLNTLTGLISVKLYHQVEDTEAILIRNASGVALAGAFVDIDNYYKLIEMESTLNDIVNNEMLSTNSNFDLNVIGVNHRGYSNVAPENTLPAYKLSRKNGFKYVETDISFTSDGVAVCLHDNTIDRTSNGSGNIGNLTYAEVSQYDFGSWKSPDYAGTKIPTFEEFILLCKNLGLHPYIELKDNGGYTEAQIQELVDTVKKYGMQGKVSWISFTLKYLTYVKNYDDKARLGYIVGTISASVISDANTLKTNNNSIFIDAYYNNLNNELVNLCIADDIPLEVWTVDNINIINNLNPYISGVTSNNLLAGKVLVENNI